MRNNITVNGWNFKFVQNNDTDQFYECRGDVMYDDEHDEMPEPSLWKAALELEKQLTSEGVNCYADYSEKGWVEVSIS